MFVDELICDEVIEEYLENFVYFLGDFRIEFGVLYFKVVVGEMSVWDLGFCDCIM